MSLLKRRSVNLDCLLQLFELICSREVVKVAVQALDILRPGVGCSVCLFRMSTSNPSHPALPAKPVYIAHHASGDGTQFRQHLEGDEPERPGGGISMDLA